MKPILLSFYFPRSIEVEGAGAFFDSLGSVLAGQGFEVSVHAPIPEKGDLPYRILNYHAPRKLSPSEYLSDLKDTAASFPTVLVALSSPAAFAWTRRALHDHPHPVYYFGSPLQEWREILCRPSSLQYLKHWIAKNRLLMNIGKPSNEHCIVGTRFQKEQLIRTGVNESLVHAIPLSIARNKVRSFLRDEVRKEYSLPDGPMIGYLGHFSPIKGVPVLIAAFEEAIKKRPDLHLAIAWSGKGAEASKVERLLKNPIFEGHLHRTGVVDPYRFLAAMDLVCLPFVHSSFPHMPLVLLESFAVGTPVITSDIGGLSEAVRDGETGWLVPPNDPKRLADAILKAFENPDYLEEMGGNAQQYIEEEECIEAHLEELLQVL